ncbi:fimbrial protein [Serratia marcescens]|uniref:fimbrial protein n=1 Tax=Serratia marcescens TaxID=615 RepID=UPI0034D79CF4
MWWLIEGSLLLLLIVSSKSGQAATSLNMTGTIIAPLACVINGEKAIDVNFGDEVLTTRVDGINYKKKIEYTLVCKNNVSNAIRMKVMGSPTSFTSSALETDKENLGVQLQADDKPLAINSWLNFIYPNNPKLQAVPVKKPGGELSGGTFVAIATLLVDYQ